MFPSEVCQKSPFQHHLPDFQEPWKCRACGMIDEELKAQCKARHEGLIESGARTFYQTEVKSVALSLLQMFMSQNMIRDLGQVMRDSNTVKPPRELTELLDQSVVGAIHFVNEVSKLKPGAPYVEQYAKRNDLQTAMLPPLPPLPPLAEE